MKLNRILVLLTSLFTMLLISVFPIFRILINVKEIENVYLSFGVIIYLLVLILLGLFIIFELFCSVKYVIKSDIKHKFLWILLLVLLNIFIFPYFNMKKVYKEDKLVFTTIIYIVALLFYCFIFVFGYKVYIDLNNAKLEEIRRIEEERNYYTTKDSKVTFTFRHGYEQKEVGEYDLYVINEEKPLVFSVFTYDTIDYEQKNPTDYLNKGVEDLKSGKTSFNLLKDLEEIQEDGYKIYTAEYIGESEIKTSTKISTTLCIYKISIINFESNPDYMIYVVEVIPKGLYDNLSKEMLEILKSVKLN